MVSLRPIITAFTVLFWMSTLTIGRSQGFFEFTNFHPPSGVNAPIFDAAGNGLRGTDYAAALYVGPTLDELEITVAAGTAQTRPVILPFRDTDLTAGYIAAFGSDSQVEARIVISGTLVWAQVRAWYVPLGDTCEEAQQQGLGGYGESAAFQLIAGHETGAGTIHAPLIGLESFSLRAVIPEPSTLSLLLLSLPVLWLAQRRHHGDLGLPVNSGSK